MERDPERETQEEIVEQAAVEPDDATTHREELELELMEHHESELGEVIGEEID